ncbi:MAG: transglycosylase SLT domain-containing protein [Bacteroidetes bacterium]|nr:transglycosylase SLT domain-containing protein [Bacteroidota bacterium]
MQRWKNIRIRKRHRWLLIPLLLIVIGLAGIRQFYYLKDEDPAKDAFLKIRERGYLVALTDKNSLDYFIYRGEPMGFQLNLLRSFAGYLNVPLKIIATNDISKLYYYLDMDVGDVIACNLPVTREGKRMVHFSQTLVGTRLVLVQRKSSGRKKPGEDKLVRSPSDFSGDTLYVQRNLFLRPLMARFLSRAGRNLTLIEEPEKNAAQLICMVSEGKIDYTVCDENLAMMIKRAYPNLDAGYTLSGFYDQGWAVIHASDSLLMKINQWITGIKKTRELKQTYLTYFDSPGVPNYFRNDLFSVNGKKLSPFDDVIRKLSKNISWDWRLLASLVYEESNFHLGVVSSRNASGLMQLMPETASKFGMDSISTPAQQLSAGVKFLKWIDDQLSTEIQDPRERINFILAAYNVGLGKVLSARERAIKYGKDPNKWNGNAGYYLTRRSLKDPNLPADSVTDLAADGGAGRFVEDILERYQHYRNNIPE